METDERPAKIRRLDSDQPVQTTNVDSALAEPGADASSFSNDIISEKKEGQPQIGSSESPSITVDGENDANGQHPDKPLRRVPPINYADPAYAGMSKNQVKKLLKKQEWESKRDERKVIRKEKVVAKRERKRARAADQEAAAAAAADSNALNSDGTRPQQLGQEGEVASKPWKKSMTLPITIILDCNFDELMRDHERVSLSSQITRCYSDNKGAPFRAHIAISSFSGKLKERFEGPLSSMYKSWRGMRFLPDNFVETAEKAREWMGAVDSKGNNALKGVFAPKTSGDDAAGVAGGVAGGVDAGAETRDSEEVARLKAEAEVVYLSSESDETLTELKPYSTYIIGGLVDKNREKGICYKRAREAGVRTARLPIGEFMEMQSRKVLATNHVNEILLRWLETGDWGSAFFRVIPKRKGGKLLAAGGEKGGQEDESAIDEEAEQDEEEGQEDVAANADVSQNEEGQTQNEPEGEIRHVDDVQEKPTSA